MPDNGTVIPRMRMSEIGYTGLKQIDGVIYEEMRKELRFPHSIKTFKKMSHDATISAALKLFEMMISRVKWHVEPPENGTQVDFDRANFISECQHDMEHSWFNFIKEVTSMYTYGFSVHEKVFRRRLFTTGSRYNDGLWAWRKLPIRSQDTIYRWKFSDDGRDLLAVEQSLHAIQYDTRYKNISSEDLVIPRAKFLLFRTDVKRDNPEGTSPLVGAYLAWKYRTALEEQEAIGVTRDLGGLPVLKIPPRYMSPDASDEEKSIYAYYQKVIRNIQNNEQGGLILPQAFEGESRQPMFEFELMSVRGTKQYDTNAIINRYDNKIMISLFADILKMGTEQVGSYSLASSKTNLMAMAIESRLKEIQDVLNHDLIPQLFKLNGWSTQKLPTFEYSDLEDIDLEEFSKAIQRIAAVGLLERDRPTLNRIRVALGLKPKADDAPINLEELTPATSRTGDSFSTATGGLNGTSDSVAGSDNSTSNVEN